MSAKLSTHVLDLVTGKPAAGMKIELWREGAVLKSVVTDGEGRTGGPLLGADEMEAGEYELVFDVGAYFGGAGFLNRVPIRFTITDAAASYHVPLLC